MKKNILILALALFGLTTSYAQIVVAGTSFDPLVVDATKTYYGVTEIRQTGFQTGSITITPPIAPNANLNVFDATYYYGIANIQIF